MDIGTRVTYQPRLDGDTLRGVIESATPYTVMVKWDHIPVTLSGPPHTTLLARSAIGLEVEQSVSAAWINRVHGFQRRGWTYTEAKELAGDRYD